MEQSVNRIDNRDSFPLQRLSGNPSSSVAKRESRVQDSKITLTWRSLNYSVPLGPKKDSTVKPILTNVTGYVAPGEMVAILGASGT